STERRRLPTKCRIRGTSSTEGRGERSCSCAPDALLPPRSRPLRGPRPPPSGAEEDWSPAPAPRKVWSAQETKSGRVSHAASKNRGSTNGRPTRRSHSLPLQDNGLLTSGAVAGAVHLAAQLGRWLEAIGRTIRAIAGARLRHVAGTRRWAADGTCRLELVGRTVRTAARAGLRHVAGTRRCTADRSRGLEAVGRTGPTAARAGLRQVAVTRRCTADRTGRLEAVGRTGRTAARAVLRHVARTH